MKFVELAEKRSSVRKFEARAVDPAVLDDILEAGRIAPTAKNIQPYIIYVIKTEEGLEKANAVSPCIYGSRTVLMACYDMEKVWKSPYDASLNSGEIDVSIVLTHIMLAAAEHDVDSCWVECFDRKLAAEKFSLPENIVPVALMPLGYAASDVTPSENHLSKKSLDALTRYI